MKHLFLFALTGLMLANTSCADGQAQQTDLAPTAFSDRLKEVPDAQLLDVRTPGEFSEGHLANAKNFDWNGTEFNAQISGLDKSKPVFVYCMSGKRSAAAAEKMRAEGFTEVYELEGGISAWRGANLPETKN